MNNLPRERDDAMLLLGELIQDDFECWEWDKRTREFTCTLDGKTYQWTLEEIQE
jgi:hypothetical protein